MKKYKNYKYSTAFVLLIATFLCAFSPLYAQDGKDEKYPANAEKKFMSADKFYDSIDRNEYTELPNSIMNVRKLILFKDINKVFAETDQYGIDRVSGEGYNPNRQVYVFKSVAKKGDKYIFKHAVFDAETKRPIAKGMGL